MTVAELIKKLEKLAPETKVLIDDDGYYREPSLSHEPAENVEPRFWAVIL